MLELIGSQAGKAFSSTPRGKLMTRTGEKISCDNRRHSIP